MSCKKRTTGNLISYWVIWFIVISVKLSCAEWFNVHSSSTSIMVDVGEDAIMNCYLNPKISAVDMEIRWIKDNDGSTIYKYRKGVEELEGVNSAFHGRTELIKDGIKKGNISLKILNIQPSDNGLYICYFQSTFMFDKAIIEILPRYSLFPERNIGVTVIAVILGLTTFGFILYISMRKYKELKREAVKEEFKEAKKHVVDVNLDPETAHPDLKVSNDRKCLSRVEERQNVSDNVKRFNTRLYVLGNEGLSKEHNYWMVNVKGSRHWTIGVASQNIPRKGKLNLSPEEGLWVIELDGETYKVYEDRPTNINISEPYHIGVYVQLKTGKIVFYDADKGHIIHSFNRKCHSSIQLYPFFSIWDFHNIHVCSDGCPHCRWKDSDENTKMLQIEKSQKFDDQMHLY